MIIYDVTLPDWDSEDQTTWSEKLEQKIDMIAQKNGLIVSQKTTLTSKKGSVHWHFKKESEKGILEATIWPKKKQCQFHVHTNRQKPWNLQMMKIFAAKTAGHTESYIEIID